MRCFVFPAFFFFVYFFLFLFFWWYSVIRFKMFKFHNTLKYSLYKTKQNICTNLLDVSHRKMITWQLICYFFRRSTFFYNCFSLNYDTSLSQWKVTKSTCYNALFFKMLPRLGSNSQYCILFQNFQQQILLSYCKLLWGNNDVLEICYDTNVCKQQIGTKMSYPYMQIDMYIYIYRYILYLYVLAVTFLYTF